MALYKICSDCGAKMEYTAKDCINNCKAKKKKGYNKQYDSFSRDKEGAKFYASKEWKSLTNICKDKFKGIDLYEYYINNKIKYGDLSHHILEREDHVEGRLDINNLIYLSQESHNYIHRMYKQSEEMKKEMQELLFGLIKRWEKEFML